MKINELLLEAPSDVLFYARSARSASEIMETDTIRFSPTFSSPNENHPKYLYFLSTTRTRTGAYHLNNIDASVLFRLDGRKLGYTLKADAIDYFYKNGQGRSGGDPQMFESEDRLFSNKPNLKGIKKYVLGADIMLPKLKSSYADEMKYIKKIYILCKRNSIPVRVYESNRDWISGNTWTLSHDEVMRVFSNENPVDTKSYPASEHLILVYKMLKFSPEQLTAFSPTELRTIDGIFARGEMGVFRTVTNALQDAHSVSGVSRKYVEDIGQIMRRKALRTSEGAARYVFSKWKDYVNENQ